MNPRSKVAHTFQELFGEDFRVQIRIHQERSADDLHRNYRVELLANEELVASAKSKHRRIAYDLLRNKVEKLYAAGICLV